MSKYIKFQVSEERFTNYKTIGFENIDKIVNEALDDYEQKQKNKSNRN